MCHVHLGKDQLHAVQERLQDGITLADCFSQCRRMRFRATPRHHVACFSMRVPFSNSADNNTHASCNTSSAA